MKKSDIKHIVKESLREAFYTKKEGSFLVSEELEEMLEESVNEYIKDVKEEIDSWIS